MTKDEGVDEASGTIGEFVWDTTTDRWRWDTGMFLLHGYADRARPVSSAMVLEHKQAEHREHAARVLELSVTEDQRFENLHVIVDASGRERTVLTVGRSRVECTGPEGSARVARGFMVDVTDRQDDLTWRTVRRVRDSTAPIQQSVGLLMGSLGLDEQQAFAVLRRLSSHHNIKVRDLSQLFIRTAAARAPGTRPDLSQLLTDAAVTLAAERARGSDTAADTP